ncbi:MAG TPA: glycosyltransferase family 4 protein [Humidesulfovibrio sp.]|uniref:glycosyltransferase family 4 protein n=1 Tax=Humidesulfovibrio sp. TaxID=2910988 RepID=UPI002D0A4C81|nr:glycosyltransferase family 4 protein [Humidesulfovibrio sp.]HWR04516.1 glycosyltransferase family 4 protein [Humidesulfovibrio sp.]
MKVAMLCNHYHPHVTGVVTVIDTIIRNLAGRVEFSVHHARPDSRAEGWSEGAAAKNPAVFPSPVGKVLSHCLRPLVGGYFPFTARCIGSLRPLLGSDLLHCHTFWPNSIVPLLRLAGQRPSLLTAHGGLDLMRTQRWPWGYQRLVRQALLAATRVIALDELEQEALRSFAPGVRTCVIPNGVDLGPQAPAPACGGPRRILFVGALNARKGIQDLVAVAGSRAFAARADVEFLLVGESTPDITPATLPGNVRLTGPLPPEQLPGLYAGAAVFVLPSYSEGMPMVILEAMAHGLPVVATPVGAVPLLVQDGQTGRLVPPGDRQALRDSLLSLIADPALAARLGANGRLRYEERHTGAAMARTHLNLYTDTYATRTH